MKISVDEASSIYNRAARLAWPKAPKSARDIIAQWYENEGAAEDFGSARDLAEFMKDDIASMIDAATDPDEIKTVRAATGCEAPSGGEAPKYVREPDERDAADAIIEYLGKSFKRIDPVGSDKLKLTIAGDAVKKMAKMKEIAAQYGCAVKLRSDGTVVVSKPENEGFRLELVDTITVPQWLYDAYIMGKEYSGHLTMIEQEKLADFKAQYDRYHLDNHDEEAVYCGTNEFDGMGGLCYDVDVYKRSSDEAKKNEDVATVAGDLSAPVYAYIGESGSGKDRRIKLEGSTLFDKLLSLRKAGTYTSIGPAEGSREWNKLDAEDQKFYKGLQAKAKKLSTYKTMGDFLSKLCSENESFLFAIRQGDNAVWVNPKATKELFDNEWHGTDRNWIEDACGVWAYHKKEFDKWKKRFGKDESASSKFTDGNEAKGETMDFEKYYKEFEKEAKKLLSAELWDKATKLDRSGAPRDFAKELFDAEFEPDSAAEEFAEMIKALDEEGSLGEAKCEDEHECEWCVEYEDVWDNKECEKFPTEPEAWARYNELVARTHGDMADIVWVEEPKCPTCECGSSAASLGAVPNGGSQVKDEGKDEFLKDALYRINFDGDEEVVAKLVKDGEDFSLIALMPDGKAKAVMTADLFSVVDYCKELLDMDPEDAIIVIENA